MSNAPLICTVFALVLFAIGGFGWLAPVEIHRTKIISAGLFFWVLASLVR